MAFDPLIPVLWVFGLTALGASVNRYAKPTFAKPAPVDLRHEIATECQVVIEALAD